MTMKCALTYLLAPALFAVILCLLTGGAVGQSNLDLVADRNQSGSISPTGIAFTRNMGQWPDSILYRADGGTSVLWFTHDGVYHQIFRTTQPASSQDTQVGAQDELDDAPAQKSILLKAEFAGANPQA